MVSVPILFVKKKSKYDSRLKKLVYKTKIDKTTQFRRVCDHSTSERPAKREDQEIFTNCPWVWHMFLSEGSAYNYVDEVSKAKM